MSTQWDEMAEQWRNVYQEHAESQKNLLESQARLAAAFTAGGSDKTGTSDTTSAQPEKDPFPDARAFADLWRNWAALSFNPGLQPGTTAGGGFGNILDPLSLSLIGADQVTSMIRRMTEGPQLADVGNIERRMAQGFELYLSVQSLQRAYEAVITRAWAKTNQRYGEEAARASAGGGTPRAPREALRRWLEIANDVFVETHRSTEYLEAQRALLAGSMDLLLVQRKILEQLLEPTGLPTRTEMDEVHQHVQELKRRVRRLEKSSQASGNSGSST
jgi:polyhydroxyalkanoate synthase subunit PhaE